MHQWFRIFDLSSSLQWPKGILSVASVVECSSMSASILIYFYGNFYFVFSLIVALFFSRSNSHKYCSSSFLHSKQTRTRWRSRIFFHVTGNYNQLNQFPALNPEKKWRILTCNNTNIDKVTLKCWKKMNATKSDLYVIKKRLFIVSSIENELNPWQ